MKLLLDIVESIYTFLNNIIAEISLTFNTIFYAGVGFTVLMIVFFLIKSYFAYEGRLQRTLDKLNRWLYYNQSIDTNNLIAFNNRMKKAPKNLRYHWQQFMLYRENAPSYYMSAYNCIEKPLNTSSYVSNLKNMQTINLTVMFFTFTLGLLQYTRGSTTLPVVLIMSIIVPLIICILNTFFMMLLRSMQNYNLSGLYQNFHLFQRYIDKASSTLPEYVDFEVLFTRKEIKSGIPVLNEYLEKRARQEQEELEKARINAVDHENYDFAQSGISGSLILDRAMKETEVYLNIRQRLLSEIQQLEDEIDSKKRNYENTSKEYQRKMQASKENVERLRRQQEETTNRIESNYIKKQQNDEIRKQEQLEKDQEAVTMRFNQEISTLQSEIEKRRNDLTVRKDYVQSSMLAEYQTFSNKVYKEVAKAVEDNFTKERKNVEEQKDSIFEELENANAIISAKEKEIESLHQIMQKAGIDEGAYGGFYNDALQKEVEKVRMGKHNTKSKSADKENIKDVEEVEEAKEVEKPAEEKEIVYDEYGGYYDDKGYYWYPNGTYYDDKGNYYDEFGGHYDANQNYFPPETTQADQEQKIEEPQEELIEEKPVSTSEIVSGVIMN